MAQATASFTLRGMPLPGPTGTARRHDEPEAGARPAPPVVLVAITHPLMCRWTTEVLDQHEGCWTTVRRDGAEMLVTVMERIRPDVVVVDSVDFPSCCRAALDALPPERAIVIGPEPDPAYRDAALAQGAGGWVSQDSLGGELCSALWDSVGCGHDACPHRPPAPQASQPSSRPPDERPRS